jgi:hypothetical protein
MSSPDLHPNRLNNLRRSQRVCLNVPVLVLKPEPGKPTVSEETHTLIVSAHGALLLLAMPVQFGDLLTVKHKRTHEELVCRVINLGPAHSGKREVGVEFELPSPRFWRIAFPPADWNPRGPDAKPPTPQAPGGRLVQKKPALAAAEANKPQTGKAPGTPPR